MTPWLLLIIAALIVACVSLYFHLRQVESQSRGEQSIITDDLREAEAALTSALEKIHRMDRELAAREKALVDPAVDNGLAGANAFQGVSALEAGRSTAPERTVGRDKSQSSPAATAFGNAESRTVRGRRQIGIVLRPRRPAGARAGPPCLDPALGAEASTMQILPALALSGDGQSRRPDDQRTETAAPQAGIHLANMRTSGPHSGCLFTADKASGEASSVAAPSERRERPAIIQHGEPSEQPFPDWRERAAAMARDGMTARQIARDLELPVGEVELALALRS